MVTYLISILFACMFFISFISKMFSLQGFYHAIRSFEVVPERYVQGIAVLVLPAELLLGLAFSLQVYLTFALLGTFLMMLMFTMLFMKVLIQKKKIKCNCFGDSEKATNVPWSITRNCILAILTQIGLYYHSLLIAVENQYLVLFMILGVSLLFQLGKSMKQFYQWKA